MERMSIVEYFITITEAVAARSTCRKKQVGAIIVKNKSIIATGYNGSLAGQIHCIDDDCIYDENGSCIRTVHAEINALAQAAKNGTCVNGAICYCTYIPCLNCYKALMSAGISKIIYLQHADKHYEALRKIYSRPNVFQITESAIYFEGGSNG